MRHQSLGYMLTRPVARPTYKPNDLLPSTLVTVSGCLASFFPDVWALRWTQTTDQERIAAAGEFGIGGTQLDAVLDAATTEFDAGHLMWPHTFGSVDAARSFASRFSIQPEPLWLLGLGIAPDDIDLITALDLPAGAAAPAALELATKRRSLEDGHTILGWEILGLEASGEHHSWLCNELEQLAHREHGVTPNSFGLVDDEQEARTIADICRRPSTPAEPVPWFAGVVVRYALRA